MKILIADDNEQIRRGIKQLLSLEKDWEVCGEAVNGTEALKKARELLPDLILLDISMPDIGGLEVARLLRNALPKVKIIIISQHDPIQLLQGAIDAGAQACVDKGLLGTDLLPAIKSVEVSLRIHRASNAGSSG